ncbi:hypothetical protein H5410_045998 [Solanum commersonii]|uniref:Uncharacterized protein n=1 Tax=Solanum commersonii TaxID=4109 RepID=A0A9J5XEB7_SOLCO|nr:hypothetical protein H5410_045998 [Solanum commersonii]
MLGPICPLNSRALYSLSFSFNFRRKTSAFFRVSSDVVASTCGASWISSVASSLVSLLIEVSDFSY